MDKLTYTYEAVCVFDIPGLLSYEGFDIPEDLKGVLYRYWLRGGLDDDPGRPAAIEDKPVIVNYCGMVLLNEELDMPDGYLPLGEDDFGYTGEQFTITDLIEYDKEGGEW